MPRVSVLMPIYNVKEEYLRESIKSILDQTFTDFEFIILDDCSTTDMESIVSSFNEARIKFYKNETNLGIANSRNKLMELATGEYAALMDNDDISLPERLQKQVEFLDNNKDVSIVSAGYETFPQKSIVKHPTNPKFLDLLKGCVIAHPCVMLRIKDLRKYDLKYDPSYVCSQDYELWTRAIRFLKMANLEEVLLKYRVFEDSITQKRKDLAWNEDTKIRQNMLDFLTSDKDLQNKIMCPESSNIKKNTLLENIFSIRKIHNHKVITILGIKIKLRRKYA